VLVPEFRSSGVSPWNATLTAQPMEDSMRVSLVVAGVAAMTASAAQAGSQSSNTSSNSSSNNGVVRERVVDTYCEDGYCERYIERRVHRDSRQRRYRDYDHRRYGRYSDYRRHDDD
jgi:hypothetical protein